MAIEHVIMTFNMVAVTVVDVNSLFLKDFEKICTILCIHFCPLYRDKHKGNNTERSHRFLNKTQTIGGNDRGTQKCFLKNAKTTQFAWNSAPMDNTNITRSVPTVGRDFKFPLDIECLALPSFNNAGNNVPINYLCHVSTNSTFSTEVLKILVKERCTYH